MSKRITYQTFRAPPAPESTSDLSGGSLGGGSLTGGFLLSHTSSAKGIR